MVRLSKLVFFILLLFSQTETSAKNPPPGTGTSDIPANIFIMLDNSGSMSRRLATTNSLFRPVDVETDSSGNIYVLEYGNNRIKKFDSAGNYKAVFGGYGSRCNQWRLARQFQIYGDRIYLADYFGKRIVVLDLDGGCVATSDTRYSYPNGIAVNNDFIFVGNSGSNIETFKRSTLTQHGIQQHDQSDINWAWGMSFNNAGNRLIISNFRGRRVSEYATSGDGSQLTLQTKSSEYRTFTDAGYDSNGNIYSTEFRLLRKYNSNLNSQLTKSGFAAPYGMHTSGDNIFVADYSRNSLKKFDSNFNQLLDFGGARSPRRIDAARRVIRKIVSNTDLTSGANFGLMEWGGPHRTKVVVPISDRGAATIFNRVRQIRPGGGTDLAQALRKATNYYTGNTRYGAVPHFGEDCAQNFIIVISDGFWNAGTHPEVISLTTTLKDTHKIKTFALGFAVGGSNYRYTQLATAGGTNTPLFADNETELLATLTDAIKQAISGKLTFTTPAVMSDVQRGDFVYQATFEYAEYKQWEGRLKKHKIESNGTLGAVSWDAADKLNNRTTERNLWTTGIAASGLNNFVTSNRDLLSNLLYPASVPTNAQLDNLINFIRGIDTYDQDGDGSTNDNIHKLADIYHSNLIVVGAPEASTIVSSVSNFDKTDLNYRIQNNYERFKNSADCGGPCAFREEVVYAGANNGILHAFKTSDGEELWGFIPPAVMENFQRIPSSRANSTNPIYGVDGSPIVKDIYFDDTDDGISNPRWRTILISGLGGGGNGFFALDITNVNDPKQIFSIKNDPTSQIVKHWDKTGVSSDYSYASGNISAEFDFRKLGETWSTPRVIRIKVDGKDKWVAVFGGGYNQMVNPNYGSAVFVIDLENEGRLLKVIDIEDQTGQVYAWNSTLGDRVGGILLPDPTTGVDNFVLNVSALHGSSAICFDPNKNESIDANFTPYVDHVMNFQTVGSLECLDTVEFGAQWPGAPGSGARGDTKFTKMSNEIVNAVPADLTVITADGTSKANYDGALIYATDLEGKLTKIDLTNQYTIETDSSSDKYRTIKEDINQTTLFKAEATQDNGRFMFTRPSATILDSNLWLYFGTGNTQKLQEQSTQVENRLFGIKDTDFPNFAQVSPTGDVSQCKTAPNCPNSSDLGWYVDLPNKQKLTAEPTVDKDRVYFPIYEPSAASVCKSGTAILTAYDTKCGNSVLNVNLGQGVLSKVVVQGDNLYIGIAGAAKDNISGFTSSGNLITGKSGAKSTGGTVQTQYWREID